MCGDPKAAFYPYRRVDYALVEQDAARAAYSALHEAAPYHDGTFADWSKDRSADHPYHFNDGVDIGVALVDPAPWDSFTTDVRASPIKPDDDE